MNASVALLSDADIFARIRLLRSPGIGPVSYFQLLGRFGDAAAALDALPELAARGGARYRPVPAERIEAEIARLRAAGGQYLFHDSPAYPRLLAALETPPPVLTWRGDLALLGQGAVALVGARNASAGACRLAREYAASLAARGYAVVSGLARGIDAAAHRGALAAMGHGGGTVGVIASGIDVTYPPEHAELQEDVAQRGLLIAEMPPGTEPLARHFPFRNRIIAGLAAGTVVVEAAPRSGSLITARLAAEAGREVMAVPGSPLDSRSRGCNELIRDGAVLVQSADDIAELLERFDGPARLKLREPMWTGSGAPYADEPDFGHGPQDDAPAEIAHLLGTAPVAIDELIRQSGTSAGAVQMALIELELAGRLIRHAGGRVSLG
ncbi:DNA-processing protein DprA [Novosphingobium sp. PASSN1]|uniref:DNA-processing protein DprA n=1 Tax=Novosphingobium sp. PASSN1 TaxID=2015561 RepID=UPI000BDCC6DB|nr:DNA-processing protein DprA [Novosphingobium sp. PASSN1]OYU37163.1 MAG: DNA-protecting protein DprA [Novosphingobium sp. PASSN1]